jgi:hypothetical protein
MPCRIRWLGLRNANPLPRREERRCTEVTSPIGETSFRPEGAGGLVGRVGTLAQRGRESLAQGLPGESGTNVTSPEGAPGYRDVVCWRLVSGRFRASGNKPKNPG